MKKLLSICVVGAAGRLGSLILDVCPSRPDCMIGAAIEFEGSGLAGKVALDESVNKGSEVRYSTSLESDIGVCDVCIDCSTAASTVESARVCSRAGKALLVLATGQSEKQIEEIRMAAEKIPVLIAPNASIGVFVLHQLSRLAQSLLGESYDVEIAEIHHKHKKDSPSGTALSLARTLAEERPGSFISTQRGESSTARVPEEIGVAGLRGGDVPGEHTVYFLGEGDRIELRHVARDRSIFARGALELAVRLVTKNRGIHTVSSLFSDSGA